MKINRKEVYRVKTGAINFVNQFGTKCETNDLNTYYCVAVRNRSGKIIHFNELVTGTPLVKRVYEKNECDYDDFEDMYYSYAFDKDREIMQVGDVDVELDQDYKVEELQDYIKTSKGSIADSLETLEIRAIELTCDGYDPSQTMEYYNKRLFLCYLGDDFIVLSANRNPLGIFNGYREINTGRKVIKHSGDGFNEFDNLVNLNRQLIDPDIPPIDRSILATRELTVDEFKAYMDLTAEEVEAKISIFLAKKSRERVLDLHPITK